MQLSVYQIEHEIFYYKPFYPFLSYIIISSFVSHRPLPEKMSQNQKTFKLNTGAHIPAIGLGTWQDEAAQEAAVLQALQTGYRHIDTARW